MSDNINELLTRINDMPSEKFIAIMSSDDLESQPINVVMTLAIACIVRLENKCNTLYAQNKSMQKDIIDITHPPVT